MWWNPLHWRFLRCNQTGWKLRSRLPFPHNRLDLMIFQGPFQPQLFNDSTVLYLWPICMQEEVCRQILMPGLLSRALLELSLWLFFFFQLSHTGIFNTGNSFCCFIYLFLMCQIFLEPGISYFMYLGSIIKQSLDLYIRLTGGNKDNRNYPIKLFLVVLNKPNIFSP